MGRRCFQSAPFLDQLPLLLARPCGSVTEGKKWGCPKGWYQERPVVKPWRIGRPKLPSYGLVFRGERPSDLIGIGVVAPSARPTAPIPVGARGLVKAVGSQTRSRRRPSAGAGGLCRSFELEPLGHGHAISKGVGSKMAERAVTDGRQSRGQTTPEDHRLTAPSSIYGLKASGLGRLCACECARA